MDFASLRAKAQEAATKGQRSATDFYQSRRQPQRASSSSSSFVPPQQTGRPPSAAAPPPPPPPQWHPQQAAQHRQAPSPSPAYNPQSGPFDHFSWQNISHKDKQAFFGLLDVYFEQHAQSSSESSGAPQNQHQEGSRGFSAPNEAPPAPAAWARPSSASPVSSVNRPAHFTSFPPSVRQGSSAADFADSFRGPAALSWPWYAQGNRLPPVLDQRNDYAYSASMSSLGSQATVTASILFSDLSMANYRITYALDSSHPPHANVGILKRPKPLPAHILYQAYEMHSEAVAQFAEDAINRRQPVGDGECWTLAAEALKSLQVYQLPKVVTSISRNHGHLIFEGQATPQGQEGRWRGGDSQIRRGDIVEWKKVTIAEVGMPSGAYALLGDPEHTAVVLGEAAPHGVQVQDGTSVTPSAFGTLEVAEQSRGQAPKRSFYDLSRLSKGEMWVYRPVGMDAYLGRQPMPDWPPVLMEPVV